MDISKGLTLAVSVIALILSFIAYQHSQRGTKAAVQQKLISEAMEINNCILNHKVYGPYALHFNIPPERVDQFTAKAVVLFHKFNFLRDAYENRDILGEESMKDYENWAKDYVRPWIEHDEELKKVREILLADRQRWGPRGFVEWLEGLIK